MNIFGKISNAYKALFSKEENDDIYDDEYGHQMSLDEMEEEAADEQTSLLMQLNPEMREYILNSSKNGNKTTKLPPKIVPIRLLADASTATDIIALLGMIRWAMNKSSEDPKGELNFNFNVNCSNRNKSPLLISIGDISIEPIPIQSEFHIGN